MKYCLILLFIAVPLLAQVNRRRDSDSHSHENRPNVLVRRDSRDSTHSNEDNTRSRESEENRVSHFRVMTREGCRIYLRHRGQCTKQSCDGQSLPITVEQCNREFQSFSRRDH